MQSTALSSNFERKSSNNNYRDRYKHMKFTTKQLTYENAALTAEIGRVDEKITHAKAERKFLLRKLLQFEKPESKPTKVVSRKSYNRGSGLKSSKVKPDTNNANHLFKKEENVEKSQVAIDDENKPLKVV